MEGLDVVEAEEEVVVEEVVVVELLLEITGFFIGAWAEAVSTEKIIVSIIISNLPFISLDTFSSFARQR